MLPGNQLLHPRRNVAHRNARLGRETQHMHGISQVIGPSGLVEGNGYRLTGAAIDADAVVISPVYAHDGIVTAFDADALAQRGASLREEFFIDTPADHAHLSLLQVVGVIDPSAIFDLRGLDIGIIGPGAFDHGPGRDVFAARDALAPEADGRGDGFQFGDHRLETVHIVVVQVPGAAFLEAFVRLGRTVGKGNAGVLGKTGEVLHQELFESLPAAG